MKKYILYFFIALLCGLLFFLTRDSGKATDVFYGFSENKERELNFDYDVKVVELLVNSGQYVKKGEPLIKVVRTSNPLKFQNIENEISLLELKRNSEKKELNDEITRLQKKREGLILEFKGEESKILSEIKQRNTLMSVMELTTMADTINKSSLNLKLESLQNQHKHELIALDEEMKGYREDYSRIREEYDQVIKKLIDERDFFLNQKEDHILKAPNDALVGFINCSPGENYSSFSKLISIYDPHPKLVKAYILESFLTALEIGDKVTVASSLNPDVIYQGEITGFGTKIMEIPNRLKKIPELKMYGRQVLISIPGENELLQNEKVVVKLASEAPIHTE